MKIDAADIVEASLRLTNGTISVHPYSLTATECFVTDIVLVRTELSALDPCIHAMSSFYS